MIVIFDVDGVLIDTSKSYHLAIWETVKELTQNNDVSLKEILDIKYLLGINNDWDVSLAGILYVKSNMDLESFKRLLKENFKSLEDLYTLANQLNIQLPPYENLIDVFNKYYYDFRKEESMIFSDEELIKIKDIADITGIITGRPRDDLDFTFNKYDMYKYFDYSITETDIPKPELRKPSPYPLEMFFSKYDYKEPVFYIGDTSADKNMVESFNKKNNKNVEFILFRPSVDLNYEKTFTEPEEVLKYLESYKYNLSK